MNRIHNYLFREIKSSGESATAISHYSSGFILAFVILIHIILSVFFLWARNTFFAVLNVNSIILASIFLFANRKTYSEYVPLLAAIEVIVYGTISVCKLGWVGGFQWYSLVAALPFFMFLEAKTSTRIFVSILGIATFYFGFYYSNYHQSADYYAFFAYYKPLWFINVNIIMAAIILEIAMKDITSAYLQMNNARHIQSLEDEAQKDPLTGLWNRRYAERLFEQEVAAGGDFCIALIDIDLFKKVNDTYGHEAGDEVLVRFSQLLTSTFRSTDAIIRWGGEEIVVLLKKVQLDKAYRLMDALRHTNEEKIYEIGGHSIHFTITIGVSKYDKTRPVADIIKESDGCMYYGKKYGRSQVITSDIMSGKAAKEDYAR